MERRTNVGVAIFVVFVMANGVDAAGRVYACWGTCYDSCSGNTQAEMFSCEYKCLKTCIPPSNGLKLYCEIGCSLKRCIPFSTDDAKMQSCFGWCTNLCNKILAP
ncbi:hypothetical protein ACS0TY_012341 [Phlomoides rotata]